MALGIYIHIPFCKSKCKYCDFNSYAGLDSLQRSYCDALIQEIKAFNSKATVDTIYFGGGTPTLLPPSYLIDILSAVKESFNLSPDCEITAECNPATIDRSGLVLLKNAGFNRLSIGLQSSDNAMLKTLGRIHTFEDFGNCFNDARRAGFDNISLDLIYGLPNQTPEDWLTVLKAAITFKPEHISCYALKIEEGTPFAQMDLNIPDDDTFRDMYDRGVELLKDHGYNLYEISNLAKNGFESRHNCKYWECENFAGFGAGAYSCIDALRYSNISDVKEYINRIENNQDITDEKIPLTDRDRMSEFCFLGLRMAKGISTAEFKQRFSCEITDIFGTEIEKNLKRKTIVQKNGRLLIPPEWIFVSNEILSDFV